MSQVRVTETSLETIADAIRAKLGVQTTYRPSEMAAAILSIPTGGGSTLITKTITENGTYNASDDNADGYSQVTVNVSGGGGASATLLMNHGQVSDTSVYMTAYFDQPVDFSQYDAILVYLYDGQLVHVGATGVTGTFFVERNSYGGSSPRFTMQISTTSIACTSYSGSYINLYVDVYGITVD